MQPYKQEFYATHREPNRTLKMESGGVCQLCGRMSDRRVEMHTPLWAAGPILYGDCCLPKAETSLRPTVFHIPAPPLPQSARAKTPAPGSRKPRLAWLFAAVAAGLGVLAVGIERLLPIRLF